MPAKAGIPTHEPMPRYTKEEAKNIIHSGTMRVTTTVPHALSQGSKSFLVLFFKKEPLLPSRLTRHGTSTEKD
jgi:hypothetical protein